MLNHQCQSLLSEEGIRPTELKRWWYFSYNFYIALYREAFLIKT